MGPAHPGSPRPGLASASLAAPGLTGTPSARAARDSVKRPHRCLPRLGPPDALGGPTPAPLQPQGHSARRRLGCLRSWLTEGAGPGSSRPSPPGPGTPGVLPGPCAHRPQPRDRACGTRGPMLPPQRGVGSCSQLPLQWRAVRSRDDGTAALFLRQRCINLTIVYMQPFHLYNLHAFHSHFRQFSILQLDHFPLQDPRDGAEVPVDRITQ